MAKLFSNELKVLYADLAELDTVGFYRIRPGKEPYICLDDILVEESEEIQQVIFQVLLDFHHSIPLDSPYRLFEMRKRIEDFFPMAVEPKPELELLGRTMRLWRFHLQNDSDKVRVIGRKTG